MRSIIRALSLFALTILLLTACDNSALPVSDDTANAEVQVTTDFPNSGQNMASNPTISPSDHNPSDGIGVIRQALDNTGLGLKMPLPAGYKWRLNTEAGGKSVAGFDQYHSDHYYSLDFGRHVKDNNGKETTVADADGYGIDANSQRNGLQIDVLAAAGGTIGDDFKRTDCFKGGPACHIIINHRDGYSTWYYHFMSNSIPEDIKPGILVTQGQFLGKMGNTGISSGAHLHFEVRHDGANGDVNNKTPELEGVTLEGIRFADYKLDPYNPTGKFVYYPSTNGFEYKPAQPYGANPRVCSNGLLIDPWSNDFYCTQQSTFLTYRSIFSDIRVTSLQGDVCFKYDVTVNGNLVAASNETCTSGAPNGSNYYLGTNSRLTTAGSAKIRYYVRAKNSGQSYLPVPLGIANVTLTNRMAAASNGQPSPVNNSPAHQSAVMGPNPNFSWTDQGGLSIIDHDMYFWYWNGSSWAGLGWILGWPYTSVVVSGLPTSKYIRWTVRSCSQTGCSGWSSYTYFYLQP